MIYNSKHEAIMLLLTIIILCNEYNKVYIDIKNYV